MHKAGHMGFVLLAFSPIAFALTALGFYLPVVLGGALLTLPAMAMLPDIDMKLPFIKHRGITHTLWFAVGVGLIFAPVFGYTSLQFGVWTGVETVEQAVAYGAYGFLIGALAVVGHVLGDIVTIYGVKFFYPISDKRYRIDWLVFPVKASSDLANYLFMLAGFTAIAIAVGAGVYISAGFATVPALV